mmetsp:Transcript_64943/g.97892  ORF Transcript_64943/g.97892 Transcript_64943/m.97892 type:complete len:239 (-) Transcript_64943:2549-3265(-)
MEMPVDLPASDKGARGEREISVCVGRVGVEVQRARDTEAIVGRSDDTAELRNNVEHKGVRNGRANGHGEGSNLGVRGDDRREGWGDIHGGHDTNAEVPGQNVAGRKGAEDDGVDEQVTNDIVGIDHEGLRGGGGEVEEVHGEGGTEVMSSQSNEQTLARSDRIPDGHSDHSHIVGKHRRGGVVVDGGQDGQTREAGPGVTSGSSAAKHKRHVHATSPVRSLNLEAGGRDQRAEGELGG